MLSPIGSVKEEGVYRSIERFAAYKEKMGASIEDDDDLALFLPELADEWASNKPSTARSNVTGCNDRSILIKDSKPLTEREDKQSRRQFYENLKRIPFTVVPSAEEIDTAVELGMQPFNLIEA